jgi:hypothetical protein
MLSVGVRTGADASSQSLLPVLKPTHRFAYRAEIQRPMHEQQLPYSAKGVLTSSMRATSLVGRVRILLRLPRRDSDRDGHCSI